MNKKYVVKLTADERERFERIVRTGKSAVWKILRTQALLKLDQGVDGPRWGDQRIAEAFGMSVRSVEHWRKQAVEEGPDSLLKRKSSPRPQALKLDGQGQARLAALACSQAPDDHASWTLALLAQNLVELRIVESISRETVRRELKKMTSNRG